MSSSKSLPSSFNQNNRHRYSTISVTTGDKSLNSNNSDFIVIDSFNSPSVSSSVKKSSPLIKPWFNPADAILNDSSTTSSKSYMCRRWSTVSGSLIVKRKHKKLTATRLWIIRQKRRTYPPSTDILKQEQKRFGVTTGDTTLPAAAAIFKKELQRRQSLQEVLTTFHNRQHSPSQSSSSSSVSKKIGKILKKKGKQPYRKKQPQLHVDTTHTEEELKTAVISIFQPPRTISSKSSTPSSPLKFPTPPKRFSAIYVDSSGKKGKSDYKRPKSGRLSNYILSFLQHGVPHKISTTTIVGENKAQYQASNYCLHKYNTQLTVDATLFLFGFVFFPFWWIGAFIYYRRSRRTQKHQQQEEYYFHDNDLSTIQIFSYLNVIFSFVSLALIIVIISLIIWLVKSS
jgi:hypothetical protein